ncbi:MAG: hypothetical protein WCG03_11435, partial [Kiritimatiellales bacterium]
SNGTAKVFFQTSPGLTYTVEESTDLQNWSPVSVVNGDGSIKSVSDLVDTSKSKNFYRTIIQ